MEPYLGILCTSVLVNSGGYLPCRFVAQQKCTTINLCLSEQIIIILWIIIQCIFPSFSDWEPTMWPANNCLQTIVLLQTIFCLCIIETMLLCENGALVPQVVREWFEVFSWSKEQWLIIQLPYCKILWFVSVSRSIICLSIHQIIIYSPLKNYDILPNLAQ